MKVYVCPVCDHAMRGRYYCRNCHQFVRNSYYIDKNYSLDRASAEPNACGCDIHMGSVKEKVVQKRAEKQAEDRDYQAAYGDSYDDREKREKTGKYQNRMIQKSRQLAQKNKRIAQTQSKKAKPGKRYHVLWMILAVYILFQIGMFVFDNMPEDSIRRLTTQINEIFSENQELENVEFIENNMEELVGDWSYETPDYEEIMAIGEESTGFTHFSVSSQEFLNSIQQTLNDADFEVTEKVEVMQNYIAVNSEQSEQHTYFENLKTFYLTDDYKEYYRLSEDSVSGRLIDTEIESLDYDRVCFYIEAAVSFLLPDNKKKQNRMEKLDIYLEKLLGEETYFSEKVGNIIISGYTYTNQEENMYHISLSRAGNV